MERQPTSFDHDLQHTLSLLQNPGLLLASTKSTGESNVMTIGWGTVGIIWGKPIFIVLVRPSRHTYGFIEESGVFTVNVPSPELRRWVGVCGSRSGRDLDKIAAYNIATSPATTVPSITIDACPLVYECQVRHYNDLIPEHLESNIEASAYGGADYHRLYYGEILATLLRP